MSKLDDVLRDALVVELGHATNLCQAALTVVNTETPRLAREQVLGNIQKARERLSQAEELAHDRVHDLESQLGVRSGEG